MSVDVQPKFEGGKNIAMKVPPHVFEKTVAFCRDVLRLPILQEDDASVALEFGSQTFWMDRVDRLSQAEVWLEVITEDVEAAADYLSRRGTVRRDEIGALPKGFEGFWISNSKKMFGGICHLLNGNMFCGEYKDFLILRLGEENAEKALKLPFVKPFDITGRAMKGWIMVKEDGFKKEEELEAWLNQAQEFVSALPAK